MKLILIALLTLFLTANTVSADSVPEPSDGISSLDPRVVDVAESLGVSVETDCLPCPPPPWMS